MKLFLLLALVGVASCSTSLIGGNRARDVSLQYKYYDDFGQEVKVEVEADRLGLGLVDDRKVARGQVYSSRVPVPVPNRAAHRFVAPTTARTRVVQAAAVPATPVRQVVPTPYIRKEVMQVRQRRPEVRSRFVQNSVPASSQVMHVAGSQDRRTHFVDNVQVVPQVVPQVVRQETRYVHPAPPTPVFRSAVRDNVVFETAPRQVVAVPEVVPVHSVATVQTSFSPYEAHAALAFGSDEIFD